MRCMQIGHDGFQITKVEMQECSPTLSFSQSILLLYHYTLDFKNRYKLVLVGLGNFLLVFFLAVQNGTHTQSVHTRIQKMRVCDYNQIRNTNAIFDIAVIFFYNKSVEVKEQRTPNGIKPDEFPAPMSRPTIP